MCYFLGNKINRVDADKNNEVSQNVTASSNDINNPENSKEISEDGKDKSIRNSTRRNGKNQGEAARLRKKGRQSSSLFLWVN